MEDNKSTKSAASAVNVVNQAKVHQVDNEDDDTDGNHDDYNNEAPGADATSSLVAKFSGQLSESKSKSVSGLIF